MRLRFSRLHAVSFAHFSVDVFNSMGPVVLTFLSAHLMPLSKTQIGLAVSLYSLGHGLSQPVFGWIADKSGGRLMGTLGLFWTTSLLLTAFVVGAATQNYALMLIPYAIAPLGSAAFHPIGTMHASINDTSAGRLSWFFLAGFFGAAVGPVAAGLLLDSTLPGGALAALGGQAGAAVTPLLGMLILVLPAALVLLLALPNRAAYAERDHRAEGTRAPLPVRAILLLAVVILVRSLTNPGVVPFLPSVFEAKGWSASEYGSVTSSYWIAGAFVGVITGKLADRFGNRRLIAATLLLSAPTFWLLPHTEGAGALVVALFMGGLSGASHSIIVAEGQRLMPARRGFASGAVLGFIFGAGAVGTFIIGVVADAYGLVSAFQLAAASVVVAALLAWRLLEARPAPTATELVALPESGLRRS